MGMQGNCGEDCEVPFLYPEISDEEFERWLRLLNSFSPNVSQYFPLLPLMNISQLEPSQAPPVQTNETKLTSEIILEHLNQFYVPLIIFVGLVGNTLSVFVFFMSKLRTLSSSYYLASLATVDSGFLLALFIVWLHSLNVSWFTENGCCQLVVYFTLVFSFLSVWLVVAFTVERFIAVTFPLQRPTMCTVRRAKMTISGLTVFALILYSYAFVTTGIVEMDSQPVCILFKEYVPIMTVLNNVDTVTTLIIPFIVIVIMNATITRKIVHFYQRRWVMSGGNSVTSASRTHVCQSHEEKQARRNQRMKYVYSRNFLSDPPANSIQSCSQKSSSSGNQERGTPPAGSVCRTCINHNGTCVEKTNNNTNSGVILNGYATRPRTSRGSMRTRNQIRITKMLLLISTVFIILNLPSHALRIHVFVENLLDPDYTLTKKDYILQQYLQLIYYTNFSINFMLYSLAGTNFRKALKKLVEDFLNNKLMCYCGGDDVEEDNFPVMGGQVPLAPRKSKSKSRSHSNSLNSGSV